VELPYKEILKEIDSVLSNSDYSHCEAVIDRILSARVIITFGAGRVGLAMQSFAKRLRHLGSDAFFLTDSTVPSTGKADLLILGTGSGKTPTVRVVAEQATKNGLPIVTVTASSRSPIADLSSNLILINSPSKDQLDRKVKSVQPMTTLFEQSIGIMLDSLVLKIMERTGENSETMTRRHNVIE
jgi:6-phospho-3-hexuloisomerase